MQRLALENNHSDEMTIIKRVNEDLIHELQTLHNSEATLKDDLKEAQHRINVYKYDAETLDLVMESVAKHVTTGPEHLQQFWITPATILPCIDEIFRLLKHYGGLVDYYKCEFQQKHELVQEIGNALQPAVLGPAEMPSQENVMQRVTEVMNELMHRRAIPNINQQYPDQELIDEVLLAMNDEFATPAGRERPLTITRVNLMERIQSQFVERHNFLASLTRQSQDKIRLRLS